MLNTEPQTLPIDWQTWVVECVSRNCDPAEMLAIMTKNGGFTEDQSIAAIVAAGGQYTRPLVCDHPDIDTSCNTVQTSDRSINVLFTAKEPRLVLLGNVLSEDECDALCEYAYSKLDRASVVGDDGLSNLTHHGRTSRGAMLQRAETELIARIDRRLAELTNWPVDHGEGLQVQWYDVGNEYRAHYDWFDPEHPGHSKLIGAAGQRVATIVLYLNDVAAGGSTGFPGTGLEVFPRKGHAVFFCDVTQDGKPDRNTLHSGKPVLRGHKVIANKWLRLHHAAN